MKRTIIAALTGFGIAIAALPATAAVAQATTLPGASIATTLPGASIATTLPGASIATTLPGTSIATSMPFCTPWLIEHARPCLPAPPVHRHHHNRGAHCHHRHH